jgi:hypothetical protein
MTSDLLLSLVWTLGLVILITVVVISRRARRHGGAYRGGVAGAMYHWQDRDKQRALEVIVEQKAEARRPEFPDGNLPDLECARRKGDNR